MNYVCTAFIIKTKVQVTFNNERRKEGTQAGKHHARRRPRKTEEPWKEEKSRGSKIKKKTSRVREMIKTTLRK